MHIVTRACLIVSVSFWSPKIIDTGIMARPVRIRPAAKQMRTDFIMRSFAGERLRLRARRFKAITNGEWKRKSHLLVEPDLKS